MARMDLLRAACQLAAQVTEWTSICDERIYQLVGYINSSLHLGTVGWVGDGLAEVQPHPFQYVDFAGSLGWLRSTSGVHLATRAAKAVLSDCWAQ